MGKRKYVKSGEEPKGYECTKQKCKWQGTSIEKEQKQISYYETEEVCPKCFNNEFYGLVDLPIPNIEKRLYSSEEVKELLWKLENLRLNHNNDNPFDLIPLNKFIEDNNI